jgi:hypothetical protein
MVCEIPLHFVILAYMKGFLVWLLMIPIVGYGQSEDDFLPEVRSLVMDSTERAVVNFCKEVMNVAPDYKFAFADREDVMMSKYFYDNGAYETVKFEFQFVINEVMMPDSTMKKSRIVKFMTITAELSTITNIYNYLFNASYTPDNIMAISVYDKALSYKGVPYNSSIVADDMKVGYWILSFFKL